MEKRTVTAKEDIENDYQQLAEIVLSDRHKESLKRLEAAAKEGVSLKAWIRRLFFGFQLSEAIERWLSAFNPSPSKTLAEQIPKKETEDVVAAWMKFSIRRGVILLLVSSLITLVTAGFLYQQIKKQDALIKLQREIADQDKIISYTKFLYDEDCTTVKSTSVDDSITKSEVCLPRHNHRMRAEAVKGYIALAKERPVLSHAHLENVNLVGFDFKEAVLNKANISGAILNGTVLSGALLWNANLKKSLILAADLREADFKGADLSEANFLNSNLSEANFSGADLIGAALAGTNLNAATFAEADITNVKGLTCNKLKKTKYWFTSIRNPELGCGKTIPTERKFYK